MNLHAIYLDTEERVDLNELEPKHFEPWVTWAKENGLGLDLIQPFLASNVPRWLYFSSSESASSRLWIEHGKRSRRIAEYFGRELGQVAVNNFWVPDGFKDNPVDRLTPRKRLMASLDEIFQRKLIQLIQSMRWKASSLGLVQKPIQLGLMNFIWATV